MKAQSIFLSFIISIGAFFIYYLHLNTTEVLPSQQLCNQDLMKKTSVCSLVCPNGTFALPGMNACYPWLNCDAKILLSSIIATGVVKSVYLAKWDGYDIAYSVLAAKQYEADFQQNLFMLKSLAGENIIQLIGFCENAIITKYHKLGSALNMNYHLQNSLKTYDNITVRFNLCISYVTVLKKLHNSAVGIRVMCDSNSLHKTLSQYLITEDLKLVLNDLDATPEVLNGGIVCGNQAITGSFVAPEQVWPHQNEGYDPSRMTAYDEKTDIYKIPDVCNWFLGDSLRADILKYKLFTIHKECKNKDPKKRPNTTLVLKTYKKVLNDFI